ncbi:MAG: hypothetical protein MR908_00310 [Firmicutes bacterium]|nr:hypothetical protein [Bacillota bacterium]
MNLQEKDRISQYLTPHLSEMIFDELSDGYLERAGIKDIMTGVPVPIRKTELESISTLSIARNMAFVIGCDPTFQYKENYIAYILRAFDKRFAEGLIADGVEGAARNDFEYACIQFRAAMQIDPDNANAYYCYGRACKDAYEAGEEEELVGRFKAESLEAFEIATLKNPQLAEAFYFLGYGYVNLGLYIKAKLTWEDFMKLSADEELKKEIAQRLEQLEQPVEIEKGYNMVLAGKYEEGIEALSVYTEGQYADWWPLWYYLGAAYAALERDDEAVASFLQVLRFSPSNAEAMEELVKLYEKLGDEEKAAKYRTKLEIVSENAKKDREVAELSRKEETMLN